MPYSLEDLKLRMVTPKGADVVEELLAGHEQVRHELFDIGIPQAFLIDVFTADESVAVVEVPNLRPMIRFGTYTNKDSICVEPISGHVVHVSNVDRLYFVNSSISQFRDTLKGLMDVFPFVETEPDGYVGDTPEDAERVVEVIDPAALHTPADGSRSLWAEILGDIEIGLYSPEELLNRED